MPVRRGNILTYLVDTFSLLQDTHIKIDHFHAFIASVEFVHTSKEGHCSLRETSEPLARRPSNIAKYNGASVLERAAHDGGIDKDTLRLRVALQSGLASIAVSPKSRDNDHLCALHDELSECFRECQIPADEQSDLAQRRIKRDMAAVVF